jgi:hypothetical protein
METVQVKLVRDGSSVWFVFGQGYPIGLESFGRAFNWGGEPSVIIRSPKGDKMPLLAAEDYCRDNGVEPVRDWKFKGM